MESHPLSIRGMMLDAARLVEPDAYYRRFIDFCSTWDINTILFRLTDDQGSALRFESHPELLTHEHALNHQQVHDLVDYARQRTITLIPEIESFGHSLYITGSPQHAHLRDKSSTDTDWAEGIIPLHPETLQILGDLYAEVSQLFPGPFLHGGCDEVHWGDSDFSKNLLKTQSRSQVWTKYVNELNAITHALGKELIVWGDIILRKQPEILEDLDKSVILLDWDYWEEDAGVLRTIAQQALDKGFRIIGGPALTWCRWGPRIGNSQLRNVDAFTDAYRSMDKTLGIIVTNWLPSRYIQNATWDQLAYSAYALSHGSDAAHQQAFQDFTQRHFGVDWNASWEKIYQDIYANAPRRLVCSAGWQGDTLPCPWTNQKELETLLHQEPITAQPFSSLYQLIENQRGLIRSNIDDFNAFSLAVEYLAHLYWRDEMAHKAQLSKPEELKPVYREIAARDHQLYEKLKTDWEAHRLPIPSAAFETHDFMDEDRLLERFCAAAQFSSKLFQQL